MGTRIIVCEGLGLVYELVLFLAETMLCLHVS
jgi:hypothetical protein